LQLRSFSAPTTLILDPVSQINSRAQTCAMRCCTLPFLSTSDTSSDIEPQITVTTNIDGTETMFVRHR
jgi:hypothetical protein